MCIVAFIHFIFPRFRHIATVVILNGGLAVRTYIPEPSSEIDHGLYLIRGDNVVLCGEVDEKIDSDIDWTKVKGEVIRGTKNA